MTSEQRTKTYFASDFHLGLRSEKGSHEREKKVVRWLDAIASDAREIFLLGDLFDFWFEYKEAVPKGFVRLLGKLAELTDAGIPVHVFTGNHDMWMFDYLPSETGVKLHRDPMEVTIDGKRIFMGHGDGLGPGDHRYKFIKRVFASPVCQWLFARLHPNFGIGLAHYFSKSSRESNMDSDAVYLGDDKEFLVQFCKEKLKEKHYDYFIFGHRHMCLDKEVGENSRYINLGEWFNACNYAVMEKGILELRKFGG